MYTVILENEGGSTIINTTSTNNMVPRITGTIKQGINVIDSFTFTILPNNIGYNLVQPMCSVIKVLNTQTNKYEFIGRVLSPTKDMSSSGAISKSYVCESEMGYFLDSYQFYQATKDWTVQQYVQKLIDNHNAYSDKAKQFVLGKVTVTGTAGSIPNTIDYTTTKATMDSLVEKLGGEFRIRYENNVRYLDYLTEIGVACNTEIRLARNLQDISQNIDVSTYYNRLIVLGTKLTNSEARLTIESVNNGLKYIDDVESIAKYGVIQGQVMFDDVTIASNLLKKGQAELLSQRLKVSNKVNAVDLSLIGLSVDSFEVGNYYPLRHEILGINDIVRIVEKSITIENPQTSEITLGDLEKDIKKYNLKSKQGYDIATKMAMDAKAKAIAVENYTVEEIYRVDSNVNQVITETNTKIGEVYTYIDNTAINLDSVKVDLGILKANDTSMKADLSTLKADTTSIKADLGILKADTTSIKAKLDEILTKLSGGV